MKDAKQFIEDLQKDVELAKALDALCEQMTEKIQQSEDPNAMKLELLTAFAEEHGYELDPEELALATAKNREVDDEALSDVSGGSGLRTCLVNYACYFALNNCMFKNNCYMAMACTTDAGKN
ncbi:MAG: Nif11 family protein [Coriobacteriia bacterium]|nr:Nif11 family protein [Coriobacteriia bacterium]